MPISVELEKRLAKHWKQQSLHAPDHFISACSGPSNYQATEKAAAHALRHTFAVHFIQNGRNILALQKILGHSSLAMTMRYAHWHRSSCRMLYRFEPVLVSTELSIDSSSIPTAPESKNPRNSLGKSGV